MGTIVILFALATFCGRNILAAPSLPLSSESLELKDGNNGPKLAQYCNEDLCKLPNCRCSSTILNETIPVEEIPQVNIYFPSHSFSISFYFCPFFNCSFYLKREKKKTRRIE